ncbi:hypothetical protein CFP65_6945 [Kitasatospora sp. MMS16-BH015]|uniref:ATP-binding protein n=1 Tax=Kitasatospora sp. MMS16-BH015 TaxID=2018025 RepID=UPI000CA25F7A|nr:tetratricopeptide repeat protein [Kitasatospora sp. MMS16-BH015]AUG81562.1 hypothetical protein CFP65_6945 [Kitasatospora sp. MMS16-BH015]
MTSRAFGPLLRESRLRAGLTQEELAARSGISAHTISVLESGKRRPHLSSVTRLAEALGLDREDRDRLTTEARSEPADSPPSSTRPPARTAPRTLPYTVQDFTGRRPEYDRILAEAGSSRGRAVVISTIDGMAGIGKTALALHVSHRLADSFPDGQLFIDLHGFTPGRPPLEPGTALGRLLRDLGVAEDRIPAHQDARAALWRGEVADRRLLVLLDNAADSAQVRPLIPAGPGSLALVTSRRRLTGLAGSSVVSLELLEPDEAAALFTRIAGAGRADGQAEAVARIVDLCGRLPLAVRIAAARLANRPAWTPAHLLARLADRDRLLQELATDDCGVATAFDVSYEALEPDLRRLFRLAALHPGDELTSAAVAALAAVTVVEAEAALDHLHACHLLTEPAPQRYVFHDLVRRYADDLAAVEETEAGRLAALERLLDHYRSTASAAVDLLYPHERESRPYPTPSAPSAVSLTGPEDARRWLDEELSNLVVAADRSSEHLPEQVSDLSVILFSALVTRDRHTEAEILHRAAHRAATVMAVPGRQVQALISLGVTEHWRGDFDSAVSRYLSALRLAEETEDQAGASRARSNLGGAYLTAGRFAEAIPHLAAALAGARQLGDRARQSAALQNLALAHEQTGDLPAALTLLRKARDLAQHTGDRTSEARILCWLGAFRMRAGQHTEAVPFLEQALVLTRGLGDDGMTAGGLNFLGECLRPSDPRQAITHHEEALAIATGISFTFEIARAHHGLGDAHLELGATAPARRHWALALAVFEDLDRPEAAELRDRLA